jgi:hypothetical protein
VRPRPAAAQGCDSSAFGILGLLRLYALRARRLRSPITIPLTGSMAAIMPISDIRIRPGSPAGGPIADRFI